MGENMGGLPDETKVILEINTEVKKYDKRYWGLYFNGDLVDKCTSKKVAQVKQKFLYRVAPFFAKHIGKCLDDYFKERAREK